MRDLKVLHLSDLHLGLKDLLDKRRPALVSSKAGQLYEPSLTKAHGDIGAVPGIVTGGRPLAVELADTDARHDGFGYALWYGTEAILRCPDATLEQQAAARRIREGLISGPRELGASYATEANRALQRRAALGNYKAELDSLPVPGGTMYLWADGFLRAGERLNELLSLRADQDPGDRSAVLLLRPGSVALLNRFRAALADELDVNPALPRDLDKQIFGYFDQLEDARAQAIKSEKSAVQTDDAQPPAGLATPPKT